MDNAEIVSLLLRSLCRVNAQTKSGLTALHYAIAYCRYEMVEELLQVIKFYSLLNWVTQVTMIKFEICNSLQEVDWKGMLSDNEPLGC